MRVCSVFRKLTFKIYSLTIPESDVLTVLSSPCFGH